MALTKLLPTLIASGGSTIVIPEPCTLVGFACAFSGAGGTSLLRNSHAIISLDGSVAGPVTIDINNLSVGLFTGDKIVPADTCILKFS